MIIRKAAVKDLPQMMILYKDAREFMRENGNGSQWGKSYPDESIIKDDIGKNRSYVCVENDSILAVFVFFIGEEHTYKKLLEGKWTDNNPYGVVHRITVRRGTNGIGKTCLDWCYEQCRKASKDIHMRADTHRNNRPMQGLLKKCGFKFIGIISLSDDYVDGQTERLAYEKL